MLVAEIYGPWSEWTARRVLPFAKLVARVSWDLEVTGREHIPSGPVVFAGNHQSHVDPPLLSIALRTNVRYLAVDELFGRSSLFDRFILYFGAIPTPRTLSAARRAQDGDRPSRGGRARWRIPRREAYDVVGRGGAEAGCCLARAANGSAADSRGDCRCRSDPLEDGAPIPAHTDTGLGRAAARTRSLHGRHRSTRIDDARLAPGDGSSAGELGCAGCDRERFVRLIGGDPGALDGPDGRDTRRSLISAAPEKLFPTRTRFYNHWW